MLIAEKVALKHHTASNQNTANRSIPHHDCRQICL
jgi:hypothetical protein